MACRAGTFLNNAAQQRGCVTSDNRIVPTKDDDLLNLRFDPTLSIVTAAEYGLSNLKALEKDQLVKPNNISDDDDRAWYIYLAHHEGLAGAEHFLRNDETIPLSKLEQQVDPTQARKLVDAAGGNVTQAYRNWLTGYMQQKIQPSRFRGVGASASKVIAPDARPLGQFSGPPISLATITHDRPDLVHDMQQILSNLGYLDPPPDGKFGSTSQWALTEFCKLNGLSIGGGLTQEIAATLLNPKQLLPDIRPCGAWIDRVIGYMAKKGYFICRHPDCKNIIYVEGVDPDGKLNAQTPNTFEDLRIVFSIQPNGVPVMQPWVATTEPGRFYTIDHPLDPKGAARIKPGQYKSWIVGMHHGESGNQHEALVQSDPLDIYRDTNKDFKREGPIITGLFGIDQHKGFNQPQNDIGEASAGCLVGRLNDGHVAFMALVKTDPRYINNNGYKFMTAVIPGAEALLTV